MYDKIAVINQNADHKKAAEDMAKELSLPIAVNINDFDAILYLGDNGLFLQENKNPGQGPLYIDFVEGPIAHRLKYGGGKGQMIAKAAGIKGSYRPSVLDATAGMGRHGLILASLGCKVDMIERMPIIAALLEDALKRAAKHEPLQEILVKIELHKCDSLAFIENITVKPDVIYLDPMFPERQKSALVKKEMRIFKNLAGTDDDSDNLLQSALTKAAKRVVVKRSRKAPFLNGMKPSYILEGKSNRFDIYLT